MTNLEIDTLTMQTVALANDLVNQLHDRCPKEGLSPRLAVAALMSAALTIEVRCGATKDEAVDRLQGMAETMRQVNFTEIATA